MSINELWIEIVERQIATDSELKLITCINGYSIETLNDVIYAVTGYRSLDQMDDEE